jgi:tetratricopeptide (TPR) repeat protein|nr:serine/threonine-protein kinase [Kofleriaceae bacterium]
MHLDDATVLDLVEGRLAPAAFATADDHLDTCESCREVVAMVACGGGSGARGTAAELLARGAAIGKYVVGDVVGEGASGRVYAAWEPELDRRVALKVLRAGAGGRDRVVREAQAMARLAHPNVVAVHEVGTFDGSVYVAMELVGGETLRAWTARVRPWRDVARVLIEVARGLAAVHAADLVHRDVKPDNVVIGDDGRARIADFGLAYRDRDRGNDGGSDRDSGGGGDADGVAGTPAYMAPEVLRGGGGDAASDQFAFGVMAYELLAGRRPFTGASWAALVRAIDDGPPSAIGGACPTWLDAIVRRCLAPEAARRHASMRDVAHAIAYGAAKRSPARWIAGACSLAAIASVATWLASSGGEPAPPACAVEAADAAALWTPAMRAQLAGPAAAAVDRWVAEFARERAALCAATDPAPQLAARARCLDERRGELAELLSRGAAARDHVLDALAVLPPPSECRLADAGAADPLPLDPQRAAAARDVAAKLPALRARVALGDARGSVDAAAALVAEARASEHAPTVADALLTLADARRGAGALADAALDARDAAATAERGHADALAARAWVSRVAIAGDRRELDAAADLDALATAAVARAGSPPRLVAVLARARGLAAFARGDLAGAREQLTDARARFTTLASRPSPTPATSSPAADLAPPSLDVAACDIALAAVAREAGDLDTAERLDRGALAIDRALRPPAHPDIARDLHDLAGVLRLRGDLDAAVASYREALAAEVATQGERSVAAGLTHNSLGLVLMARRDWAGAATELATALDILDAAGHGDRAFAAHNLGLVAQARGEHAAALTWFARAGTTYTATIGDAAAPAIRLSLDRARSELALGHRDSADRDARAARDAARTAGIDWIATDATTLLAHEPAATPPARPPVVAEPAHPHPPAPDGDAPRVDVTAPPPPPPPQPRRDVGVYGANVTF